MSKTEFILAVVVVILVAYLVLPARLRAHIRQEVRRGVQWQQWQEELAQAEREHERFFSEHPELANGDHAADRRGVQGD